MSDVTLASQDKMLKVTKFPMSDVTLASQDKMQMVSTEAAFVLVNVVIGTLHSYFA